MKNATSLCRCLLVSTAMLAILSGQMVCATLIDFNAFPDRTPVSAGNPYSGIVNLQAASGVVRGDRQFESIPWTEGVITGGVVAVIPVDLNRPPALGTFFGLYGSSFTMTFLKPVTHIGMDVAGYRGYGYLYTAENGNGETITRSAAVFSGWELHRNDLFLPDGYYFTLLTLGANDVQALDAAVWVDNLELTVAPVGDLAPTALFLAVGCLGLAAMKRLCCRSLLNLA